MHENELALLKDYIPAQGPIGLRQVLDKLLEQSKNDSLFAAKEHFIMYQLGDQKSLIKVDMSEDPILFWYFDLLGRPATGIVKKTIFDFLWEKCGVREQYLQALESKD